ncbi:MAG TPA: flagellar filament capping protein FliD, partial [Phycisphaerae bacterium]|nr:flagellar filament capping protein FliD [Phycisphaerae bacterium]
STNTLEGVISGVKLDLIATSETPVNISVKRDDETLVQQAKTFVDAFNAVIATLDSLTRFDPETEDRGILQGDATARRVRQSLAGTALTGVGELAGGLNRLGSVGIKINSSGKLDLDEAKFRAELAEDPEAVKKLFALEGVDEAGEEIVVGLAGKIQREIERLTDVDNGVLTLQDESLETSESQLTRRIEQLAVLLDSKRARLLADFQAMESVLANLQSQQSALSALAGQIGTLGG